MTGKYRMMGGECFRCWLGSKQATLLILSILCFTLSMFLFQSTENPHPGRWSSTTCRVTDARFYQPCREEFECRVCQVQTQFNYRDGSGMTPYDITLNVERIARFNCFGEYSRNSIFQCFYPSLSSIKKRFPNAEDPMALLLSQVESRDTYYDVARLHSETLKQARQVLALALLGLFLYMISGIYMACYTSALPKYRCCQYLSLRGCVTMLLCCCSRAPLKVNSLNVDLGAVAETGTDSDSEGMGAGASGASKDLRLLLAHSSSDEETQRKRDKEKELEKARKNETAPLAIPIAIPTSASGPHALPTGYYAPGSVAMPVSYANAYRPPSVPPSPAHGHSMAVATAPFAFSLSAAVATRTVNMPATAASQTPRQTARVAGSMPAFSMPVHAVAGIAGTPTRTHNLTMAGAGTNTPTRTRPMATAATGIGTPSTQPQQHAPVSSFILAHSNTHPHSLAAQPHAIFTSHSRPHTPAAARHVPVSISRTHTPVRSRPETPRSESILMSVSSQARGIPGSVASLRVGSVHGTYSDNPATISGMGTGMHRALGGTSVSSTASLSFGTRTLTPGGVRVRTALDTSSNNTPISSGATGTSTPQHVPRGSPRLDGAAFTLLDEVRFRGERSASASSVD